MNPVGFKRNFLKDTNLSLLTEVGIPKEIHLLTNRLFICGVVYFMRFLLPCRKFYTVRNISEKIESSRNKDCQSEIRLAEKFILT